MKIIAINGSARKNGNTQKMLNSCLEGAIINNAEVELINLYDLNFKGCYGCLMCKVTKSSSYGKCIINDDLKQIFKRIEESDAVVFGSPIYFLNISGELSSFLERLFFQYLRYEDRENSLCPRKIKTAFIFTMNITEELFLNNKVIQNNLRMYENYSKTLLGYSESIFCFNTLQSDDYTNKILYGDFEEKIKNHKENFPKSIQEAFELGKKLTI